MPEKVTSLNGLKVTLEYGSYNTGALNAFYVKLWVWGSRNHYRVVLFFVRLMIIVIIVITLLRWIQHLDKYGCMTETRAALVEVHIRLQKAFIVLAQSRPTQYGLEAKLHYLQTVYRARQALTCSSGIRLLENLGG